LKYNVTRVYNVTMPISSTRGPAEIQAKRRAFLSRYAVNQAGGGKIKEHAWRLHAETGTGIEPTQQAEILPSLVKVVVAIRPLDLPGMLPHRLLPQAIEQ
jgi:hypothetical protein